MKENKKFRRIEDTNDGGCGSGDGGLTQSVSQSVMANPLS